MRIIYEGSISSQRIQEYTATLSTRLQTIRDVQLMHHKCFMMLSSENQKADPGDKNDFVRE